jgi:hypothetical protein
VDIPVDLALMTARQFVGLHAGLRNTEMKEECRPFVSLFLGWSALNALYNAFAGLQGKDRCSEASRVHFFADEFLVPRGIMAEVRSSGRTSEIEFLEKARGESKLIGVPRPDQRRPPLSPDARILDSSYRVRCSLFHGGKRPSDELDVTLCAAADALVIELVARACKNGFW